MLSLYACACAHLEDAYLNLEWLFKLSELMSKTREHVPVNHTCFIWDSNCARTDLTTLGHGSQGTAGSKGIKGFISVH